jgi:hypothetical protein
MFLQRNHIKRFTSGIFLILFIIALIPKQVLHDYLTQHTHATSKQYSDRTQLDVSDYYCGYNTPVLSQTALLEHNQPPITIFRAVTFELVERTVRLFISERFVTALRGPPVQQNEV